MQNILVFILYANDLWTSLLNFAYRFRFFFYSNQRASRNLAEKQRRDNLNANISTMATLVPSIAGSSRRMDKISILRLATAFLRTRYSKSMLPENTLFSQIIFLIIRYIFTVRCIESFLTILKLLLLWNYTLLLLLLFLLLLFVRIVTITSI